MKNIYFQKSFQRGFGTYPLQGDTMMQALTAAVSIGYRAFDTAQMYGNEQTLGEFLAHSDIPREEWCVTTKVHPDNFSADRFLPSVEESLRKLRLDYTDALLLHWPHPQGKNTEALRLLQEAYRKGLTRHIGISNYTSAMMRDAKNLLDAPLVTNQVEFHPLLDQTALLEASVATEIPLSAYCSVAKGHVLAEPVILELATDYDKAPSAIVLRWTLQKGVSTITMSTRRKNMETNFGVNDFALSSPDMAKIDTLTRRNYRIVDKELVPWAPQWD